MRMYRVCGNHEVLGHRPGSKFSADLTDVQETRLVAGGHIERVTDVTSFDDKKPSFLTEAPLPDDRAGESDPKE